MINHLVLFNTPIIHVAVADMDATYGAYVAVENAIVSLIKSSILCCNISTVSCIHICNRNLNDRGMNYLIVTMAPP